MDYLFKSLDFLYIPTKDIHTSVEYYVKQLGGTLHFKIHAYNAWVAGIELSESGPLILLADHLKTSGAILIYAVDNLQAAHDELVTRGWQSIGDLVEIPPGPCYTFEDLAGQHFAIYENSRPHYFEKFKGQID